jgi:hypothetical protein
VTDYTDLIARLRLSQTGGIHYEAADALKAQARRIAELEGELTTAYMVGFEKGVEHQKKAQGAAAARIAELETALKPFADLAEKYNGDVDDQPLWDRDFMPVVGDLRAARAALEKKKD